MGHSRQKLMLIGHRRQVRSFPLLLACLAICHSSALAAADETDASKDGGWFCQMGEDEGGWACVQDEALVRSPQPTRLPEPKATPEPAATAAPSLPPAAASVATRPQPAPVPQAPAPEAPPPEPERSPVPQPAAIDRTDDVPRHVALAYRPQKPTAIMDLPADFIAAQLMALSTRDDLERFAQQKQVRGMSAARIAVGDKLMYVLLLGIYESREIAEQAVVDLPPPFNDHKPWLRTVGSLQKAMVAGDELEANLASSGQS